MFNFLRRITIPFLVGLVFASPAAAISQEEIERQYAVAERKLKEICEKQDALRDELILQQSEQKRLKKKVKQLERKAGQEIYTLARRMFREQGHFSDVAADLADSLARGELGPEDFNTPQASALATRRNAIFDKIKAFEGGEVASQASYTKDLTEDLKKLTDRKIAAAATLIDIELKNSKKGTIEDPDKEDAEREEADAEFAKIMAELAEINRELDNITAPKIPFSRADVHEIDRELDALETDATRVYEAEIGSPEFPMEAEPEELDISAGDPNYQEAKPNPRWFINIGINRGVDPTFTGFGQRPVVDGGFSVAVGVDIPLLTFRGSNTGWHDYLTFELQHAQDSYNSFTNLATGVRGLASGDINSTYFGFGYRVERDVAQNWRLGGMVGIGALNYNINGPFSASGTVPAAKLAAYGLYKVTDTILVGPGIEITEPLKDISGFGGATPSNVSLGTDWRLNFGVTVHY